MPDFRRLSASLFGNRNGLELTGSQTGVVKHAIFHNRVVGAKRSISARHKDCAVHAQQVTSGLQSSLAIELYRDGNAFNAVFTWSPRRPPQFFAIRRIVSDQQFLGGHEQLALAEYR